MCITEIKNRVLDKKEQSGIGWKVFRVDPDCPGRLIFEYSGQASYPAIPINRWMHAENNIVENVLWSGTEHKYVQLFTYLSGFHILKTRAEARRWAWSRDLRVRKVKYRNARIIGRQNSYNVIVADKILVPRV